jgi:hypothetical protein
LKSWSRSRSSDGFADLEYVVSQYSTVLWLIKLLMIRVLGAQLQPPNPVFLQPDSNWSISISASLRNDNAPSLPGRHLPQGTTSLPFASDGELLSSTFRRSSFDQQVLLLPK